MDIFEETVLVSKLPRSFRKIGQNAHAPLFPSLIARMRSPTRVGRAQRSRLDRLMASIGLLSRHGISQECHPRAVRKLATLRHCLKQDDRQIFNTCGMDITSMPRHLFSGVRNRPHEAASVSAALDDSLSL